MYQAQQYSYAQSQSDMDCSVDAEMAAYPYGSFSSGTTDLMSFSGRRSVQDCAETLSNVVDTSQLVKYLKDLTPAPISPLSFPKPTKKVEFAPIPCSPVPHVLPISASSIPNHPPKEWKSSMVRALTTASGETFHIADVTPVTDYSYDSPYNLCVHPCEVPCNQSCGQLQDTWEQQQPVCEKQCALEQEVSDINDNHTDYYENQLPAFEPPCFRKVVSPYPGQLKTRKVQYSANVAQAQFLHDQPPQGSDLSNLLTTASPNPVNWTVLLDGEPPINLPTEQPAYVPTPISMKPYEKEDYTKKSPLLNALVTAPFRSFTPFDHDVITQLEDLPTPKQELRLIDALTVASPTPFHPNLPRELPAVTETERIQNERDERAAIMGQEVNEIINHTIETQVERRGSAFAKVSGFRSVHPFNPMPKAVQAQEEVVVPNPKPPQVTNTHPSVRPPSKVHTSRSPQPVVSFPPPLGIPNAQFVQSGLHEPATIPKYQRQWFNLASQSPVRTPEPHELKENVPLAFVELSNAQHQQLEKQHQTHYTTSEVRQALAAVSVSVTDHSNDQQTSEALKSYHLHSTDSAQQHQRNRTASPASRPYTPSLINKPAPTVPYYQQNLVAEECDAPSSHLFLDPRIDSPMPDRCPSPAPGPPPNPLRIHAPRTRSPPDQVSSYQTSTASKLTAPLHLHGGATLLAQQQAQHASGSRSFHDSPEVVQQSQVGNTTIQSRVKQSELNEEQRSNYESASTTQIGNTQVQRKTRVVEEFEHSQKASTVEIYKSTGNAQSLPRSIQSGGSGGQNFASYKNQPKVTAAELQSVQTNQQDGFSCYKSSQQASQKQSDAVQDVNVARGAPMGFVAREARRLSSNSQYKVDLATYESKFPQKSPPTPSAEFPLKTFLPIAEEPKAQTYNVSKKQLSKPPPGYQQIQPDLKFTTRSSLAQPPPNPNIQTTTNQRVKSVHNSSSATSNKEQITQQQQQYTPTPVQANPSSLPTPVIPTQAPNTYHQPTQSTNKSHTSFPPPILPIQSPHTSFPPPQPVLAYQQPHTPFVASASQSSASSAYTSNYNLNQSSAKSAFQSANTASAPALPSSAYVPPKPHAPTQQQPSVVTVSDPNPASAGPAGAGGAGNNNTGGGKALKFGATSAPKRGRGVLNQAGSAGGRIPQCGCCSAQIR